MSLLEGRAKKFDGKAIDYVSIFNWADGKCIGQATPDASGNWYYYYHADTQVGITYVADGCEPITHGAYSVERNNDLNPNWVVVKSPFATDLIDKTGKTWTAYGNANVSGGALQLDGNGDYLSMAYSPDFHFMNNEDVTIRFKVNVNRFSSDRRVLLTTRIDGVGDFSRWALYAGLNSVVLIIWKNDTNLAFNSSWSTAYGFDTEFELSLERQNMVWRLYINGNQVDSAITQTINDNSRSANGLDIGSAISSGNSARNLKGSMRNLQILKGIALGGGGALTPPISQL